MKAVFLSASVPVPGRGNFSQDANPYLIQCAVQEFVSATLGRRLIVWGGHPAITPMVWAICKDLGVDYSQAVVLYQSKFFQDQYPEENRQFGNVVYVDAVEGDRQASLARMRQDMLSREDLSAAVFIGGMEGIFDEHALFTHLHPQTTVLPVPAPGGAARQLAVKLGVDEAELKDESFTRLFHKGLGIALNEQRTIGT